VALIEGVGVCVGKFPSSGAVGLVVLRAIENTKDVTCISCGESSSGTVALGHSSGTVSLFVPTSSASEQKQRPKQLNVFDGAKPASSYLSSTSAAAAVAVCDASIITLRDSGADHRRGPVSVITQDS
jgi:hypothetical protein